MSDKEMYCYITYAVPKDVCKNLILQTVYNIPAFEGKNDNTALDGFMPMWYGAACFPEDDIED